MRPRSQGGFTLLELTIVLAIVGLLAVGALKAASALRENAGISETSKRLDTLVMALQTFLMKHNRLPCPADPNIDTNLGDENCPSNPSGEILRGVIPSRTLGLSGGRLMDAWDRQFTYVVIAEATKNNSFTSNAWPATLELRDKAGGKLIQRGIAVIISHGANGSDAYQSLGATSGAKPPTDEEENFNNDHTFVQAPYSTNEKNPFDDQVLFLTEDQIVQPLANQGALITKQAQALEKLKRIENALIGYMAMDIAPPPDCTDTDANGTLVRKARRGLPKPRSPIDHNQYLQGTIPDDLAKSAGLVTSGVVDNKDPWGEPIDYKVRRGVAGTECAAGFRGDTVDASKVIFRLTSFGPERNDSDDDIFIERRGGELLGTLLAAGIQVDNTNPPPTPPPSTP
jgi:prepilin-type N-terminal cleavage/methylation domain-containing protein